MCKILKETVIQANGKTMRRSIDELRTSNVLNGEITVSANFCGTSYSHKVSVSDLNKSYGRSLKMTFKK